MAKKTTSTVFVSGAQEPHSHEYYDSEVKEVIVKNIKMPFGSMITFMVKWALASIPAMLILFLMVGILAAFFKGLIS